MQRKTVNVEIQEPNSPKPTSYQSKLPYPERMKVRENDKPSAQHSRFLKMFKQLCLEIGLKDALVEMPKFNKWLSSLLRNKEKLKDIAITTVNAECSAIIMNKVPEKLEDPGKFLIPCALQELNRTSALADSGASINLLPHSIYKQLGLEALTPTRMTLELANRSITHPMGIAEDVVVRVDGFTFLADFVVVNFEPDPRVPIILGRPFLRTAKALIDLYEETLTLRVGKEELADPLSGVTTNTLPPSSSLMKTSDNFEKFADELAPLDSLPPGNDDLTLKKDFLVISIIEKKNKDVVINVCFFPTLTSPEESELILEEIEEKDSIPPGIDLPLPPTLEVSSSNPTSLTLTGEKDHSWKISMFFSLVRFVWKMMNRISIRKKIICLLATYLHKKTKPLSRPQEVEEIKEKEDEVSSTDKTNITRKPSKTGKHEHEKRKSTREAKDSKPKPEKVKSQSKKVKPESIDETPPSDAITPDLPIMDSLVMEDEHLDTIRETDSDKEIESSVENLNLTPSKSEDLSDYVSKCDLPFCDNSPDFNNDYEIFSNPLFDSNTDYTSSDDESSSKEDVPVENFKIYSNPLLEFNEEIFSSEINPLYNEVLEDLDSIPPGNENDHFNVESDLIESLLNKDTLITSPKIDFLLEEFASELALINPIPPGIVETNFNPKEDIRLIKKLLYDNSSPRPPEELNSEISDAIIESFSSSPIPVKDSDSLMEEIDIFLAADDSIPPGIDSDGYDSEEDNLFLEYEPDPGELTRVVVEDIFGEPRVHMPNVLPTHPTLCQDLDFTLSVDFSGSVLETLLPFSSEIEDKVFNPGILVSKEEKSPHLLSHRGFKAFKIIHNFLNESPMMIYGGDMPILDVPYLHFYPP
ncbi:retrovirus-related pol polyprotein from transposon TNT 1-94 [Tanacetum coccineum]